MSAQNSSRKVYFSVVEDVIASVREAFLDEGIDEQVLQELKQLWETKLATSRALEVSEPEPAAGNIPFQLMQSQQSQAQAKEVQPTATMQSQIPMPVQLSADGQISNAASMAFNAQNQMFQQQVQALVNVNPGAPITLHQTANGQYILQALPQSASQAQMVIPQQILHSQPTQIQQIQTHHQGLPQLDGTYDMDVEESVVSSQHMRKSSSEKVEPTSISGDCCSGESAHEGPLAGLAQATGVDIELEVSNSLSKRLRRDLCRQRKLRKQVPQLDGNHDTSSSDDDNFDDDDDDDDNNDDDKEDGEEEGEEEEPLNSDDDVSEEDPQELFDTDNVVVCQFEKINRNKNKWKFNLKDGIMNLEGKDHVFQKGTGEADW